MRTSEDRSRLLVTCTGNTGRSPGLGCVPMFWPFFHKVTCGLLPKVALCVSNYSGKELH